MGENSKIEWTDHTFNAWIGCDKVSPGCKHCYAEVETFPRVSRGRGLELWGPKAARHVTSDENWRKPFLWNKEAEEAGERRSVFCLSLGDAFEDRPDLAAPRARLFTTIVKTPHLDWLLLTKRPENAARLWRGASVAANGDDKMLGREWLPNIWIGTTVEDQEHAEKRIPHLLDVPAAVRFLSCEPLLGSVDVSPWLWPTHWRWDGRYASPEAAIAAGAFAEKHRQALVSAHARFVDWVIVGGESGGKARPFDLAWARAIVRACEAAKAPCFVKQLGRLVVDSERMAGVFADSDARTKRACASLKIDLSVAPNLVALWHKKGADMKEWPDDLRVRAFPETTR